MTTTADQSSGIRTTCQFNSKIFDYEGPGKHLWCSDPLSNYGFDESQTGFFADSVAMELNEAGDTYTIKSAINDNCIVNLTVKRISPGFQVGKDGTSYYGTDPANPWGTMRHAFWPRCAVTGTMQTPLKTFHINGRGLYIYCIQGMKPHHAAAKWNYVNFQTPNYSAVLMEYTTPPAYGQTVVGVGGIATDKEIICGGVCTVKHNTSNQESELDWPEPRNVSFSWTGEKDGKAITAELVGDLPPRSDRVDVLAHLPGFVKSFISGATGLKPHIFQVRITHSLSHRFVADWNSTARKTTSPSNSRLATKKCLRLASSSARPPSYLNAITCVQTT